MLKFVVFNQLNNGFRSKHLITWNTVLDYCFLADVLVYVELELIK